MKYRIYQSVDDPDFKSPDCALEEIFDFSTSAIDAVEKRAKAEGLTKLHGRAGKRTRTVAYLQYSTVFENAAGNKVYYEVRGEG